MGGKLGTLARPVVGRADALLLLREMYRPRQHGPVSATTDYFDPVIGIDDIRAAARRLELVADRTPVVASRLLDELMGAPISLKAESLQRTGSFKFRGAYNRIASIPAGERPRGVLAFSSGNHAQAVAL